MNTTTDQYEAVATMAQEKLSEKGITLSKAWLGLTPSLITNVLWGKIWHVREIEENNMAKISAGSIKEDHFGIINYSLSACYQINNPMENYSSVKNDEFIKLYTEEIGKTKDLMQRKNHDYGEAWRKMRMTSITDLILVKLLRIRQIESNKGKTLISEPIEENYRDIINYSIFYLIRMEEEV